MFNRHTLQRPTVPPEQLRLTSGIGPEASQTGFAEIGRDIIAAFAGMTRAGTIWDQIVTNAHTRLMGFIERGDSEGLCKTIAEMQTNNLAFGIGWSRTDWEGFQVDKAWRDTVRAGLMENLTSVAAMLGVIPVDNPEAGQIRNMAALDGDALALQLDRCLGYELASPRGFSRNIGISRPSGAVCDYRTLWGLASSERIMGLLRLLNVAPENAHVLEIGGGVGNLALQCLRRGVGRYSVIDIPTTRAIQTYVARSEFPDMPISLQPESGRLALLLPSDFPNVAAQSVDVVVSEDCIPELDRETVATYVAQISRVCRGLFLSLNHESQAELGGHRHGRILDLCSGPLQMLWRSPHWMRRGYIEEVFRP